MAAAGDAARGAFQVIDIYGTGHEGGGVRATSGRLAVPERLYCCAFNFLFLTTDVPMSLFRRFVRAQETNFSYNTTPL